MTGRRRWRWALAALALPLALAAAHLADRMPGALVAAESVTLDWRYHWRGPLESSGAVALVMVDDATVAEAGRWPIPRRTIADAVRAVTADGARVVVLDLLLSEPEVELPPEAAGLLAALRGRVQVGDALARGIERLLAGQGGDRALAGALAAAPAAALAFAFDFAGGAEGPADAADAAEALAPARFRARHRPAGDDGEGPPQALGAVLPAPDFARAAALGHVSVLLGPLGALRHDQTVVGFNGELYPSLSVAAVRLFRGVGVEDAAVHLGRGVALGTGLVPTDRRLRIAVNHYGPPGAIATHGLADVAAGRFPAGRFRGRVVVVGASARAVGDRFATAFTRAMPGAEHHATVIDNILSGRALVADERTRRIDAAAILAGGLAAAAMGAALTPAATVMGALLLAGGWFALAAHGFASSFLWLSVAFPVAAILGNAALFGGLRVARDRRARRRAEWQRRNLARYFSPAVAERLMNRGDPTLPDTVQPAAILFADLAGFTGLAERLPPAEAMDVLRAFYRRVEDAVFAESGTLDKFLGDGALAVFGIPEPSMEDGARALRAAVRLARSMEDWSRQRAAAGLPAVGIGIGLHCGPVLVGDVGGGRQYSFTVIGDAVNVASRLQASTRALDATILASDTLVGTVRAVGAADALAGFRPLPAQRLRGRQGAVTLWAWGGGVGHGVGDVGSAPAA